MGQTCGRPRRPEDKNKWPKSAGAARTEPREIDYSSTIGSDHWHWIETEFGGAYRMTKEPDLQDVKGTIASGLKKCKGNPAKYEGIWYQTDMTQWPEDQQQYKLLLRTGSGFHVEKQAGGGFTFAANVYQALTPHDEVEVDADEYTESVLTSFQGHQLGPPLMPGRGQGVADVPGLKIIGDIDPDDVKQGGVGDCWMLSGISSLAEFDGAIAKLFRKTDWKRMPNDDFNTYTVTLWELSTWEEVDIEVDERLCAKPNGSLLGSSPSGTGELWVPILEKALAAHCGGWDKIDGGQCTHAWRLLTGCKEQYSFSKDGSGAWSCCGTKNPNTGKWEELANSPHDGFSGLWPMKWPKVGGGGDIGATVDETALFEKMCDWDDQNYIMGAGTRSGSDKEDHQGIVDGHAYSVLTCLHDVADSGINLVKVRNPWGQGEFTSGKWDDDGPGWDEHPEVLNFIQPALGVDDGSFWMEQDEFFQYFGTVYLCAKDMSEFIKA